MRLGAPRRLVHLRLAGVGPAVADVVERRAVEHRRLLPDRADLGAQRVLGQVADVDAVEQDAPALDLVEPEQQRDRRGLAGAGAADQRHPLAGADVQGEAVERRRRAAVAEADVLEVDRAAGPRRGDGVVGVDDGVRRRQRAHAVLDLADVGEDAHRGHRHPARHLREPGGDQPGGGDVAGAWRRRGSRAAACRRSAPPAARRRASSARSGRRREAAPKSIVAPR